MSDYPDDEDKNKLKVKVITNKKRKTMKEPSARQSPNEANSQSSQTQFHAKQCADYHAKQVALSPFRAGPHKHAP
jgi:hypothetical protein